MPVIVFDVNETLSDMSPMAERFAGLGAPRELAATWFAGLLRDAFGLTIVGAPAPFRDVAEANLRAVLTGALSTVSVDDAVAELMDAFMQLPVHPDVVPGVHALADAGHRLMTLSNGSASVAEGLLARAGVRDRFEALLSVQDAPAWKPDRRAYELAISRAGVPAEETMLVAVHPWDIDGAHRAGMRTAWLNREGAPYPAVHSSPEITVTSLPELAEALTPAQ
jgi:2-haloacid dehalogenase